MVILVKTLLRTQARAHVVLFSSDVVLAYTLLVDYYGLRFQIEFNFRDAKQYWGLEYFMNVSPTVDQCGESVAVHGQRRVSVSGLTAIRVIQTTGSWT